MSRRGSARARAAATPGGAGRWAAILAWSLWALHFVVSLTLAGSFALGFKGDAFDSLAGLLMLGFATVGALIAAREPRNAVGWILLAVPLVQTAGNLHQGVEAGPGGPSSLLVAAIWIGEWSTVVWLGLIAIFLPLLFPDGRLPSPRWRPLAWLGAAATVIGAVAVALTPGPIGGEPVVVANPLGLSGAAAEAVALLNDAAQVAWLASMVGAVAALGWRLRSARGAERRQVEWFAYVLALLVACVVVAAASLLLPRGVGETIGAVAWNSALALLIFGLPLCIAIAIFRHRLYDIDLVINRTLVYGALSACLALSYAGGVVLLGQLFSPFTRGSDLAIAGSTLAVAALFRPLRGRIQSAVDRRFYRHKYDSARTLEGFSARLREQVDLDALGGELEAVVRQTMQPAHVSLWLRAPERSS